MNPYKRAPVAKIDILVCVHDFQPDRCATKDTSLAQLFRKAKVRGTLLLPEVRISRKR
ncbi:hypothetical protein ARMSODRAFT_963847 [Armillaria solidipes]|uniref:Uncharacterized protein n=1 Tax=Armillaria solidipes TaxID=1076256 RepID=A0A2H3AZ20_9AGAR|nr:hypothetical protein ARMSODRAFT_963847 [Armillaria solidipes]